MVKRALTSWEVLMNFNHKDLLGLENLTREEILMILDSAAGFKQVLDRPIPIVPVLRGKTIANLFFEPSTRTHISFSIATKRLSADSVAITAKASSVVKGETLLDTAKNIEAMKVDGVVIRHSASGAPHFLAERIDAFVVNAGDGCHEHPTQGLLDIFTMREHFKQIRALRVLILGDITHSRVARSNIFGLVKLGAKVSVCGPPTLIPVDIEKMGVRVFYDLDEALQEIDVINVLRLQLERQDRGLFPTIQEYRELYGLTNERFRRVRSKILVMHPGPINRGVEIDPAVADSKQSVILDQVKNGVAVRMAVLYILVRRTPWQEGGES